ncbi:MAG: hypothetical protein JXA77_09760 [Bacteroidales bacterium]|nr:hypothetical protein [Bacteroidales bacterium]MBN2821430.1 hypothetical protein [Bacteroidales bacterium]
MLPDINRPEWGKLIKGEINPDLSSFSLKMKINSSRQFYKMGRLKLEDAVKELHELCVKYEKIYAADLEKVFTAKTIKP